jgi:hypothetical protein
MNSYSDLVLPVLCLVVAVGALWTIHRIHPRVPH